MYTLDRNQVLSASSPPSRSRSGGNELTNLPKAEIRVCGGEGCDDIKLLEQDTQVQQVVSSVLIAVARTLAPCSSGAAAVAAAAAVAVAAA